MNRALSKRVNDHGITVACRVLKGIAKIRDRPIATFFAFPQLVVARLDTETVAPAPKTEEGRSVRLRFSARKSKGVSWRSSRRSSTRTTAASSTSWKPIATSWTANSLNLSRPAVRSPLGSGHLVKCFAWPPLATICLFCNLAMRLTHFWAGSKNFYQLVKKWGTHNDQGHPDLPARGTGVGAGA
jgi:hypothetical protein